MTTASILVWDTSGCPPEGVEAVFWRYTDNGNDDKALSILSYIEEHSDYFRHEYLNWVKELGNLQIDGETLVDHLKIDGTSSYWWLTLLAEKCNFIKSPEIVETVKFIALSHWLIGREYSSVSLVTDRRKTADYFHTWCQNNGYMLEVKEIFGANSRPAKHHTMRNFLPEPLIALLSFFKYLCKHWPLKGVGLENLKRSSARVSFFSYLFNTDSEAIRAGRFHSVYWNKLIDVLEESRVDSNWLHIFVESSSLSNARAAARYLKRLNAGERQVHVTLDSFLSLSLVFRALRLWVAMLAVFKRTKGQVRNFFCSGIRLYPFLYSDWERSFKSSHALSVIMNHLLMERAMKLFPQQTTGYYLMENQAWEYSLLRNWRSYKHGEVIGVPHTTIRYWDYRYFRPDEEVNADNTVFYDRPDRIAVNGPTAKAMLEQGGWKNRLTIEVEALRFLYLANLDEKLKSSGSEKKHLKIIVFGDYVEEMTQKMIRLIDEASRRALLAPEITVKPHPNCPISTNDFKITVAIVTNDEIGKLLNEHDIAITSNMTSAAVDAYCAGLQVISILDDDNLNMSPLRGLDAVQFVSGADDLAAAVEISSALIRQGIEPGAAEFFYLDSSIPRWRALLNLANGF